MISNSFTPLHMMLTGIPFLILVLFFLVPWLLRWVWNMTCPQLFGAPTITYWQAFRLLVLVGILFGGWRVL